MQNFMLYFSIAADYVFAMQKSAPSGCRNRMDVMEAMIRIAVVDDEDVFEKMVSERIRDYLQDKPFGLEIRTFRDGAAFLAKCRTETFDLVFLDIDMPQLTGIEIAQRLRMKQADTELVFVSNKEELVYETFQYTPFRFIRKSRFELEIGEALECYLIKRRNQSMMYGFSTEQGSKLVNAIAVRYIEVRSHKLTVHLQETAFTANGNLSDVEKEIGQCGFIRIHKSFLVNFRSIDLINHREVLLDDGRSLPLSRGRQEAVKLALMRFSRGL